MKFIEILFLTVVIILLAVGVFYRFWGGVDKLDTISIGGRNFRVELAKSPAERYRGLSGRESLQRDEGMLFVFEKSGQYPFTMRGMLFSLDFIFVNEDKVVSIIEKVKTNTKEPIVSKENFDKVLEVNAGTCEHYSIKIGDKIKS